MHNSDPNDELPGTRKPQAKEQVADMARDLEGLPQVKFEKEYYLSGSKRWNHITFAILQEQTAQYQVQNGPYRSQTRPINRQPRQNSSYQGSIWALQQRVPSKERRHSCHCSECGFISQKIKSLQKNGISGMVLQHTKDNLFTQSRRIGQMWKIKTATLRHTLGVVAYMRKKSNSPRKSLFPDDTSQSSGTQSQARSSAFKLSPLTKSRIPGKRGSIVINQASTKNFNFQVIDPKRRKGLSTGLLIPKQIKVTVSQHNQTNTDSSESNASVYWSQTSIKRPLILKAALQAKQLATLRQLLKIKQPSKNVQQYLEQKSQQCALRSTTYQADSKQSRRLTKSSINPSLNPIHQNFKAYVVPQVVFKRY